MSKSYVSLEEFICPILGIKHNDGAGVLLDTRLKPTMERTTVTGFKISKSAQDKLDAGYVALIEVSNTDLGDKLDNNKADRTGRLAWVKKEFANAIFNQHIETMAFINKDVYTMIEDKTKNKG